MCHPFPHDPDIRVPISPDSSARDSNEENAEEYEPGAPELFSQSELNDSVRDLHLKKENSELIGSRLKEKNELHFPDSNTEKRIFNLYFLEEGELSLQH